ncbi:MAG TPA: serine hydrolase [Nocardioides sp.]|uniref:serine hydrolase domain-containing protein n=1 Tax=Nocardioides sp. TaxID=35761 RepID=UPI002ED8B78C
MHEEATARRRTGRRGRWLRRTAVLVALLLVAGVALQTWARLSLDTSAVARAVVWLEADVEDIDRFPARTIAAPPAARPLPDCAETRDPSELTVTTAGERRRLDGLLRETRTRGFLVLRQGCVLLEAYGAGAGPATLLTSFSVAKSVLATLVGIALQRGDLPSLDVPVTDYLPELAEDDGRFSRVTLASLLAMGSGLHYEERGLPWSDDAVTYYSPDLRATALSATIEEAPMRTWRYNNYNPLLVGMLLERATGVSVASYAERHLWAPLGAERDASWSIDSEASGLEKLESGFNATLRDWARFGLLAARAGRVGGADGAQVAEPAFWERATSAQPTSDGVLAPHYGLWWWLDEARPGAFQARGNLGQFIHVSPSTDVVVLRFGEDFGIEDWPAVLGQVADRAVASR